MHPIQKFKFYLLWLGIIFIFFTTTSSCDKNKKSTIINPNGDSELALLMREMTDHLIMVKNNLNQGKEPGKYPLHFSEIYYAHPTDPEVRDKVFEGFAENYLNKLRNFYAVAPEKRPEAYKLLVNSCAGCHQQICPGPLAKIKKLY